MGERVLTRFEIPGTTDKTVADAAKLVLNLGESTHRQVVVNEFNPKLVKKHARYFKFFAITDILNPQGKPIPYFEIDLPTVLTVFSIEENSYGFDYNPSAGLALNPQTLAEDLRTTIAELAKQNTPS